MRDGEHKRNNYYFLTVYKCITHLQINFLVDDKNIVYFSTGVSASKPSEIPVSCVRLSVCSYRIQLFFVKLLFSKLTGCTDKRVNEIILNKQFLSLSK